MQPNSHKRERKSSISKTDVAKCIEMGPIFDKERTYIGWKAAKTNITENHQQETPQHSSPTRCPTWVPYSFDLYLQKKPTF